MLPQRHKSSYSTARTPASETPSLVDQQRIERAREVFRDEARALEQTAHGLGDDFATAVKMLLDMRGSLIVVGMGKAGLIGKKLAATFASTGTPAHFVHPAEAIHGDLGRFGQNDLVLVLSNSGETDEITRILPMIVQQSAGLIAMTSNKQSSLGRSANVVLEISHDHEACNFNLAPTSSTTAMLAYGDALALVVSEERGFSEADFARFHPGGALGLKLMSVDEAMRSLDQCRIAKESTTVREIFSGHSLPGRRTGAVMLVDDCGVLKGIFTDSDLARMLERRDDQQLDRPVSEVMTTKFTAIASGAKMQDAIDVLSSRKISELPVVNQNDQPLGLIDVTDIIQLVAAASKAQQPMADTQSLNSSSLKNGQPVNQVVVDAPPTIRLFK